MLRKFSPEAKDPNQQN